MSTNTQKLRVLRARTDYDLVVLVQRELDKGLSAVGLATTWNSSLFAQAVKAQNTAVALLPRIAGLSVDDRLRMEAKLEALRSRLDTVPTYANVASYYPASFAS